MIAAPKDLRDDHSLTTKLSGRIQYAAFMYQHEPFFKAKQERSSRQDTGMKAVDIAMLCIHSVGRREQ